jgi:cellulose synthase/poly-beta-1,6-N-acetylglucosamine synthase-like glycosyltransferase
MIILIVWFIFVALFVGVPVTYLIQMKKRATKPWKLKTIDNFFPSVAILIPVHNEEKTIRLKLENLRRVEYPAEKMEAVIVNDASTDNTMVEIRRYTNETSFRLNIFDSKEHLGKTNCLNRALKTVDADVVIISDADCFWPSDILHKAMPYLSDPNVGAVTARELLLNPDGSWVTLGEQFYDSTVQSIRIGESKEHSTIFFQGGFAAYKRNLLHEFDTATDDSGTALDFVQRNKRTLLIPEVGFYTTFPTTWKNKITLKVRRATHLQRLWAKCFGLLVRGKLVIPKKIALPELFMHLFNPLLLVVLVVSSVLAFVQYPLFLLALLLILFPVLLIKQTRTIMFEALQSNLILLIALTSFHTNKRFKLWTTEQESRSQLTEDLLRNMQLI